LWKVERPQVTNTVHEAAKNGDRSENGDYIYGKRRLREIDSRVRFLNKRLEELKVIDRPPDNTDKIYFGAWVNLEDEAGEERRWRIVGPDEFDLGRGLLSMDSPMARS
ncbi:MAG: GreA/GreB family elongation factor, partial [Halieaceae bacterium]|nr:GreA/GreB family elongation factor [Halieaceae bacterium]